MFKIAFIALAIAVSVLLIGSNVARAWNADNFNTVQVGDYTWYNYDFESKSVSDDNVDWPISVIFWGEGAEVNAAHSLLWFWNIANTMYARYYDGSNWEWDSDAGRKSALGDGDAWHARIYAEVSGDQCTHSTWSYYVVASAHRDYRNYPSYEYFGDTNDANDAVLAIADDTVGAGNVTNNFLNMYNYEDWRYEGASEPYHIWDFDGQAEGVHIE